ncbi:hypothetical protein BH11VER1_BH11VER1_38990 [soil metagenome]
MSATPSLLLALPLSVLVILMWQLTHQEPTTPKLSVKTDHPVELSPLPKDEPGIDTRLSKEVIAAYEVFDCSEVFTVPAGPMGLEYSARASALNGKKIRVTGFMVKHYNTDPTVFLFSETPRLYNEREEGLADSLPPGTLHVIVQVRKGDAPAWRREKMTLYGTMELGGRQELSGRISHVRLTCDAITNALTGERLEVGKPIVLQRNRAVPPTGDLGALPPSVTPNPFFNPRRNINKNIKAQTP